MTLHNPNFNSLWVEEDCESLTLKDDLVRLYQRLVTNKEIVSIPPQAIFLKGPTLPDFSSRTPETSTLDEQEHLLNSLLANQLFLAEVVSTKTPFAQMLVKRLLVLQRIYNAVSHKFHAIQDSQAIALVSPQDPDKGKSLEQADSSLSVGSDALIRLGVKTGLSMLFSLFKMNWQLAASAGQMSPCNDILTTALEVAYSLPPLSLANENKLTSLGTEALNSVTKFLHLAATPQSGADMQGQQLAAQLLLAIAMQRGLLHHLLDWVGLALQVSASAQSEARKGSEAQLGRISMSFFKTILGQMIDKTGGAERVPRTLLSVDQEGMIPMFEAAMFLLEELHCAADEYTNTGSDFSTCSPGSSATIPVGQGSQSQRLDVFIWGSNSSHQLAEGNQEKILTPKMTSVFADCQQVEAGQFCSFLLHLDGSVSACGKGSYGHLGLGDSNNQPLPRKLTFDPPKVIKKISSSKGSDGHTLALSVDGELFSWGDGDYGKLGLGGNHTQKFPKLIQGPLTHKVVKCMSAGYRHSAAVTMDGELYTWGEGDYGRLGHGDKTSRNLPKQVKDISPVGQVACGSSHTLAISQDGKTVWSFGGGDHGKLGHGDMNHQTKPVAIQALNGMYIRKVACSSQTSLALTSTGQVYAWGSGACLGFRLADVTAMSPKMIEDLQGVRIMDITSGDSHCLALSYDNEVFAWGNNAMGQLGQGHAQSPVTRPRKVIGLDDAHIQQISAGTSHSVATTALPFDGHVIAWHRPFCVDLQESTFSVLGTFLERYCDGFDCSEPPPPFQTKQQHHKFVLLCLKLLSSHLSLALTCGLGSEVLGSQTRPLRILLFRLVDTHPPEPIKKSVTDTLVIGASLLLPPLRERMELLHSLLPQGPDSWESLTTGQRMQLGIILTSLQDNQHIAALLGLTNQNLQPSPSSLNHGITDLQLAEQLMKTILMNLAAHTERSLNELGSLDDLTTVKPTESSPPANMHSLLSSLQKHLLAYCQNKPTLDTKAASVAKHLHQHLLLLLPLCGDVISVTASIISRINENEDLLEQVEDVVLQSPAGKMLSHVLHALLVLPLTLVMPVLPQVLTLLPQLYTLAKLLPGTSSLEEEELEFKQGEEDVLSHQRPWSWLIDMERTCGLLIGTCLGGMLHGPPQAECELDCDYWLNSLLFSNGLKSTTHFKKLRSLMVEMTMESPESLSSLCYESSMDNETKALLDLGLGVPSDTSSHLLAMMVEFALHQDLNTCEMKEEKWLDLVTRFFLAAVLKHCNLWRYIKEHDWPTKQLEAIFVLVYKVRGVLISFRGHNQEEDSERTLVGQRSFELRSEAPHNEVREDTLESPEHSREILDESVDPDSDRERQSTDDEDQQYPSGAKKGLVAKRAELTYEDMCSKYLEMCLFLLLCVRPPLSGDSSDKPSKAKTKGVNSDLIFLAKVKEMLRRLGWRLEGMDAMGFERNWHQQQCSSLSENVVLADLPLFVCGDQQSGHTDSVDKNQLISTMSLHQERLEASIFLRTFRTSQIVAALGIVVKDEDFSNLHHVDFPRLIKSWQRFMLMQIIEENCVPVKSIEGLSASVKTDSLTGSAATPDNSEGSKKSGKKKRGKKASQDIAEANDASKPRQQLDRTQLEEGESCEESSDEPQAPMTRSIIRDLLGISIKSSLQCKCGLTVERDMDGTHINLMYPDCRPMGPTASPLFISFGEVVQHSMTATTNIQAWCSSCNRYQHHCQRKNIQNLPDVIALNCHTENEKNLEFWLNQFEIIRQRHRETAVSIPVSRSSSQSTVRCRFGNACHRPDCRFQHDSPREFDNDVKKKSEEDEEFGPGWIPLGLKIIRNVDGSVDVTEISDEEPVPLTQDDDVRYYELYSVVSHVLSASWGNLVSCNQRKERVTCTQWYLINDFCITPVGKDEAVDFKLDWNVPCIIHYTRRNFVSRYDLTANHFHPLEAIKQPVVTGNKSPAPRRKKITWKLTRSKLFTR